MGDGADEKSEMTAADARTQNRRERLRRFITGVLNAFETLHLYGAAGIVCFGWALGRLLEFESAPYVPVWFAGALLVYNIDRLKHDPADAINLPVRTHRSAQMRRVSIALAALAAGALVLVPLARGDWLLLALTLAGGVICLNYSLPVRGFRLKDVPLLKTFFAPVVVVAACLAPPLLQTSLRVSAAHFTAVCAWACAYLFFNMTVCDLRDLEGDRAMGTCSVPVFLGRARTRRLLIALIFLVALLGFLAEATAPARALSAWRSLMVWSPAYLAVLFAFARRDCPEWFYAWCVEGMLFVPALVLVAHRFSGSVNPL